MEAESLVFKHAVEQSSMMPEEVPSVLQEQYISQDLPHLTRSSLLTANTAKDLATDVGSGAAIGSIVVAAKTQLDLDMSSLFSEASESLPLAPVDGAILKSALLGGAKIGAVLGLATFALYEGKKCFFPDHED